MKKLKIIILIIGIILTSLGVLSSIMKWPGSALLLIGPALIALTVVFKMLEKNNSINNGLRNRILKYGLFILGSLVIPFIMTWLIISITGDREEGMGYGFTTPFLLLNLIFAFFIIKSNVFVRLIAGLIVTVITLGFMWIIMSSKILDSKQDMYGIWSTLFTYIVTSVTTWEYTYRIIEKIKKNNAS